MRPFPPLAFKLRLSRFNSRTLGRVRRVRTTFDVASLPVSIHAPWEGCDYTLQHLKLHWVKVSIHAPWEGCDTTSHSPSSNDARFNSRTLGRVRLNHLSASASFDTFQFTHPGKGATSRRALCLSPYGVSIHAPWEGCDCRSKSTLSCYPCFNSRTLGRVRLQIQHHEGWTYSFNSRTLGRVRQAGNAAVNAYMQFQFTHPGKGATDVLTRWLNKQTFQFTHPGKGATSLLLISRFSASRFNSRTLGRVRPVSTCTQGRATQFQFTHPGKGATTSHQRRLEWSCVSIHAPWEGCDTESKVTFASPLRFQFTHPGKGATFHFGHT